jgi:hypothetical protein
MSDCISCQQQPSSSMRKASGSADEQNSLPLFAKGTDDASSRLLLRSGRRNMRSDERWV